MSLFSPSGITPKPTPLTPLAPPTRVGPVVAPVGRTGTNGHTRTADLLLIEPPKGIVKSWQHVTVGHDQALLQMERRQQGLEQSILTPWANFNDAGMNGLEWNSMVVLGARPAQGKTLFASLITNNAHRLNPDQDFLILDFQFEMLAKNSALREISSHLGVSIKALNSAERDPMTRMPKFLSPAELARAQTYVNSQRERKQFVVEKAQTTTGIGRIIEDFWKMYRLPFIVTLDHSILVKKDASQQDKVAMLQDLGATLTDVKRRIPCLIIVLSQLNRTIEDYTRQEKPGSHGNYPNEGDIFGGDALVQHADIVGLINRPAKYHLKVYGPERWSVIDPYMLAMHFVKVRSGDPRISFFKGEFEKMNIVEILPPPTVAPGRGMMP